MLHNQQPVKQYQSHRENQRERILEAAEKLFIRDGIDRVNISDIAQAARLSRHTIYEYFPNKQEMAWAIFQKLIEDGQAFFKDQSQPEGNGFQQLERLIMQMVNHLQAHPEHSRFIVEFNTLYARESSAARLREMIQQSQGPGLALIPQIIRQGIADGSIRPDLDPHLLSAALLNLVNAVNSRFALLGSLISEEYGHPAQDIYQEICRTFLRGIQS